MQKLAALAVLLGGSKKDQAARDGIQVLADAILIWPEADPTIRWLQVVLQPLDANRTAAQEPLSTETPVWVEG